MTHRPLDLQLDWDADSLATHWIDSPDHRFFLQRLHQVTVEAMVAGGARRVLDIAAGEAGYTVDIARRGPRAVALDPSPRMLARARGIIDETGARVTLVRGIAETLPFRDQSFDGVLCHSAIDHMADPDGAVREMARVLTPDGRLVLGAGNYDGIGVRLSRFLYRLGRGARLLDRDQHQFWDSPVPGEHTFEATARLLERLCSPYLEVERRLGVSIGWGAPGWGALLQRLPEHRARAVLGWLDRQAARKPGMADFAYLVCRPRPRRSWPVRRPPNEGGFVVQPDDVVYPYRAAIERFFWGLAGFGGTIVKSGPAGGRMANAAYTGDPERSWLDDLLARGPFRDAAVLGCDEDRHDAEWLRRGGSPRLDVYELSPPVIRRVRDRLGPLRKRVRFIEADLNFAELPEQRYEIIWSSGCVHHIVNLEHLYAQVERALRPGGLFALHDYIGERRMQYSPARLARLNALLGEVPARFRHGRVAALAPRDEREMSPFCAARSDEVLQLAAARFELVHTGVFGGLFPLLFHLDLDAIARDDPALFARLVAAEDAARHDPATPPCSAYAVFRKR
jgi:SAM-dependent methyltransferase